MGKFKNKYQWKGREGHFQLQKSIREICLSMMKQREEDVLRYGMFDSCYSKRETVGVKSLIAPGRSLADPEPTRSEGESRYDHPEKKDEG